MKKFNKIGSLIIIAILTSCTDLTVSETDSQFLKSEGGQITGDPTELLKTNYNDLGALTDQANVYSLFEHTTDEMLPPTRGVDWGDNGVWRTLHAHTWDPTHSWVLGAWNVLNERVFRTTLTLAVGPNPVQEAEAKLLRAFYMHQVLDLWGVVPFREADEGPDIDPLVMTSSEAFDYILTDIETALPDLPNIGPSAKSYRASKAAAYYLLAKLYLNKAIYTATPEERAAGSYTFADADLQKVIDYVDLLEAEGYSLDPNYFNIFHPSASKNEVILHSPTGSPANMIYMTTHYDQNPSGWNGFTTIADFYNKAIKSTTDQRIGKGPGTTGYSFNAADFNGANATGIGYGYLIGQQYKDNGDVLVDSRTQKPLSFTSDVPLAGASTDKGIRVMKYHPSVSGFGTQNFILMRFGTAYLMRAEARLRMGDIPGALVDINALRTIRGADVLPTLSEADFLDELGRELYWEGSRRTDQIRFGTYFDTWHEKTSTETFRVVYPIPALALGSNPNLAQNPGY